jgi:putative transcriptional regulator
MQELDASAYGSPLCAGHNEGVLIGSTPTKGRLLIATPPLEDPNFDRSVVFMLEHQESGAIGVVLNRPTTEPLGGPLDRWADLLVHPAAIFAGGPVAADALVALARTNAPIVGLPEDQLGQDGLLSPVIGEVVSADLSADPMLVTDRIRVVRIFRGYAGWGPGQLESEIETGSWLVVDSLPEDVFTEAPQDLWRIVLRRQPGRLSWLSTAPDDLSAN